MKSNMRMLIVTLCVAAILAALPSTAQANKKLYKARLSADAEVHEVVGSTASGNFILATTPGRLPVLPECQRSFRSGDRRPHPRAGKRQ